MSFQSRQAGTACERIEIRQGIRSGAFAPAHKLSENLYDILNLCTGRPLT